ncbi:MAG: hypothetical protein OCD01_07005 [Fibrobacterales bacterium]
MIYNTTALTVGLMAKSFELQLNNITDGLIAAPRNARHRFTIRLLNRMLRSYGVKIYTQQEEQSQRGRFLSAPVSDCLMLARAGLEDGVLKPQHNLFGIATSKFDSDIDNGFHESQVQFVVEDLVDMAMHPRPAEETMPFSVVLKDGMIVVREHTLSHIIGISSSLNIPDGTYIENIITAIYVAKSLHVSVEEIRAAISELCLQSMEMEMVAEKHGMKYFDNSNIISHRDATEILHCFEGECTVILGGSNFKMTPAFENALVDAKAYVVALPGTEASYLKGLHERLPNVFDHCQSMSEVVHESESLLDDGGAILFFPSLNGARGGMESFDFFREVLKS